MHSGTSTHTFFRKLATNGVRMQVLTIKNCLSKELESAACSLGNLKTIFPIILKARSTKVKRVEVDPKDTMNEIITTVNQCILIINIVKDLFAGPTQVAIIFPMHKVALFAKGADKGHILIASYINVLLTTWFERTGAGAGLMNETWLGPQSNYCTRRMKHGNGASDERDKCIDKRHPIDYSDERFLGQRLILGNQKL